ncbi:unnamed protein product [Phyllotreta striolata]|uniref:SAP30-binding protein n=1 Tax=Phyllotreta striolata TaxID=444603 RepID=A0A9N9XS94_PHYSR|nr:unnamed protein product [Phyllotreta striolata]
MTSALASLTATYTDSEGEEDGNEEQTETTNNHEGGVGIVESPINSLSDHKSNGSSQPASPAPVKVTTKVAKLVSYQDDTYVSDEDGESEVPHEVIMLGENDAPIEQAVTDDVDNMIPPEPPGHCSTELQDKIAKLHEKMLTQQMDMNAVIQKRKDFRNPSIYEKLIQFCDLNELGTNYPPAMYDPLKWSKESYYEELAKVQKAEMDRRDKERKSKVEFVSGTKKNEDDKKRKSKWDQPGGGGTGAPPSVKPAGLIQPSLTTSSTGTKGTVISAFGSLPKKPKP